MKKNNEILTATIANAAYGYSISVGGNPAAYVGNACAAAEIVADYFGNAALYDALIGYLDAGCELVDIELEDGDVIINALRDGIDVGAHSLATVADADTADIEALFIGLPNLYN